MKFPRKGTVERTKHFLSIYYKSRCSAGGRTTDEGALLFSISVCPDGGSKRSLAAVYKASACEARNGRVAARASLMRGAGESGR